jgi:enoyl-CoA hydratase
MSVQLHREDDRPHVAHLRLDVGDLNLFTDAVAEDVQSTVETIPDEVAVLTIAAPQPDSEVRGLSAGLDLEWGSDLGPHEGQDLLESFYEMIQAIRDLEAVTVCGCGDYTLGVGFELAAACEFRVATADATLGLPEVEVGLPTVIQGGLLLRLVGEGVANELIYTAETISGERATDLGIVTDAPAEGDYHAAVDALVDDLAAKSPRALQSQKRVMQRFRSNGLESGMEASVGDIGRVFGTEDQREAMAAFLEDREPEFEDA